MNKQKKKRNNNKNKTKNKKQILKQRANWWLPERKRVEGWVKKGIKSIFI